jgi:hypothetical protein
MSTQHEGRGPDRSAPAPERRQQRRARTTYGLTTLFEARDDLRGVSPVADFFADSVRWTV